MLFSEILASIHFDGSTGSVAVTEDWLQGRATFGGLVAAVGNATLRKLVPGDRLLRSLQTTFVGPASAGTWQIKAEVLRVGKAVTLARCDILDNNQLAATITGVYGGPRPSAVEVHPAASPAPRAVEDLTDMRFQPGVSPAFLQHFAIRWAQSAKPFSSSPRTPMKAFIRHRDAAALSESHVVALIDCTPSPAIVMIKQFAPASSLVWTLEFVEHEFEFASECWWRIDTDIDAATSGYVNQTAVVLAPNGRPVAFSRQLVAVFG